MAIFTIRPKYGCTKADLRIFYMHADGYVPRGYKKRPSTTVPEWRLGRVLDAMATVDREKFTSFVFRG